MLHLAFLAAAKAAASCGRLSRASALFPVSNSAYSSMMVSDSAVAKRSIAARCASMPSPERCCCCVETRRYATAHPIQTAYHRMAFGRSAIQSNVIALFMLQQHRRLASFPTALRHARTAPTYEFFSMSSRGPRAAQNAPRALFLTAGRAIRCYSSGLLRLAEAFDPFVHRQALNRHDCNRPAQNTTRRELQPFMRSW